MTGLIRVSKRIAEDTIQLPCCGELKNKTTSSVINSMRIKTTFVLYTSFLNENNFLQFLILPRPFYT